MKIWLQAKKIKQTDTSHEHQAFQSTFQSLQQDFARQRKDFDELHEEYRRHAAQRVELIDHIWMVGEDWKAQLHGKKLYIDHLTKEIYKSIFVSWMMVKKVEAFL